MELFGSNIGGFGFLGEMDSSSYGMYDHGLFFSESKWLFSPTFKPSRGIRQGDPILPYLFVLCAEELTCMLKNIGPQYISRGVRVSRHAPWISHLLFADDCMIFA